MSIEEIEREILKKFRGCGGSKAKTLPNSRQPLCRLQVFPYVFTYDAYWFFRDLRGRTSLIARLCVEGIISRGLLDASTNLGVTRSVASGRSDNPSTLLSPTGVVRPS